MAKKKDFISLADYRIGRIREGIEKHGRMEVICASNEERLQLKGFMLEDENGSFLPRARESDTTRLFVAVGIKEAI